AAASPPSCCPARSRTPAPSAPAAQAPGRCAGAGPATPALASPSGSTSTLPSVGLYACGAPSLEVAPIYTVTTYAANFCYMTLVHCMRRGTARETREGALPIPYYRMHLRPARHSRQHAMLLELELAGNEVYYCAPAFHQPAELN